MIDLVRTFETRPFPAFLAAFTRTVQHLAVGMVDGAVVGRDEADAAIAELTERTRGWLDGLAERPGDALRMLDALRRAGFTALEPLRAAHVAERAQRFPPPAAVRWREIAELRALADADPARCEVGPPVEHVEFAAELSALGTAIPDELLALYAACSHVALRCRTVDTPAGGICAGDALRAREGRLGLFQRTRGPRTLHIEQPGVSIGSDLGTWWLILEDSRAPRTRRPLDLQAFLRFTLLRYEAPSLEVLVTDLSWQRFFRG